MFEKIKSVFSKKSAVPSGTIIPPGSFLEYAIGNSYGIDGFGSVGASQAMQYYRESSAVATAVDLIADEFERIQPVIQTADGKFTDNHPVLEMLRMPNDYETYQDLAGAFSRHYLLTHNTQFYAGGLVKRPPVELFAIKPQNVSATEAPTNYAANYFVGQGVGSGTYAVDFVPKLGARYYNTDMKELYHIQGFSSHISQVKADSPLQAIALEIAQRIKGRVHNVSLLDNGARPTLFVQFKDSADIDELRLRRQYLNEQAAGATNAGKIMVTAGQEMDVKEFGINNRDMDFSELDRIAGETVYMRYKIPLVLTNTKAATLDNMKTAVFHLYDWAVLPLADKLLAGLSKFLLPRYGMDPSRERITYNPETIKPLTSRMLDELKLRKDIGVESIDELREFLPNRDPIGLDQILVPSTLVPAGIDFEETSAETAEDEARRLAERDSE
jgi:HK97 family phage portal protein